MASLVGAILFLRPFTLPIFHSPFPTSISHFHFPLSFTTFIYHSPGCYPLPATLWLLPSARYPMAARVHSVRPVPFLYQVPLLPEPLPDGAPLQCPGQQQLRHSAPANSTSVSPPDEAIAWPVRWYQVLDEAVAWLGTQVSGARYGCRLAWCGVPANHRAHESPF